MQQFFHRHPRIFRQFILMLTMLLFTPWLHAQSPASYDQAIVLADRYFKEKNYLDAKAYYQMALKYKTGDPYAKKQIATIVEQLKNRMEQEEAYFDIIDLADVFFEEGAYEKALDQYKKALTVIPDDEYAHEKILEIQRKQTEERDKQQAYNNYMVQGESLMEANEYDQAIEAFSQAAVLFPDRERPKEKIEAAKQLKIEFGNKKVLFDQEKELAERYLIVKDYAKALEHFEAALAVIPDDEEVLKQVETIRPEAEKQQRYNREVEAADELYISKDFLSAKAKYAEASKLWPENSYPGDMIRKIDEQLAEQRKHLEKNYQKAVRSADSLLALELYTDAKAGYNLALVLKPNETYPKNKLAEIDAYFAEQQKAFEANYQNMLAEADRLFDQAAYEQAREKYEMALQTKPDDSYPKNKLQQIEDLIAQQKAEQEKTEKYKALVAEADRLFADGSYDLAIKKYREAQAVKNSEQYPVERIEEIKQLLADAEKQKEIDEAFGKQMMLAVRLMKEDKLEEAKSAYANALELKPYDPQPKLQMARIDSIVEARIALARMEKESARLIAQGDSLQNLKLYDQAIAAYEQALTVKPKDPVAGKKLSDAKVAKRNYEKALADQQLYEESIAKGDQYFQEESFELAQAAYQKAAQVKPNEAYPKQQLVKVDEMLKKLEQERQQRFEEAIAKGDNFFEAQNYNEAVLQYKIAESIKPGESYPKQRIAECNGILAEQLKKLKARYDIAIADADKLYASKIYDKAIKAYKNAEAIFPDEDYPRQQITKITNLIEKNAITDVLTETKTIQSDVTERLTFKPLPINVRKSNYILIKARNKGDKSFKLIFTYGSDKGKNGGFVVQVPDDNEYHDFIIRVGNQYKWFSDDNNWIEIYPQNGDIEISMIRISKSD